MQLRPAAVPLVNMDPYTSVWSMADRATDDFTRHWTGRRQALTGLAEIDGRLYRFLGRTSLDSRLYAPEPPAMAQRSVTVAALTTDYVLEADGVRLTLTFFSPHFLDDLPLLSRPVCFVQLALEALDGRSHRVRVWFDASAEHCVNRDDAEITIRRESNAVYDALVMGNAEQKPLCEQGDTVTIHWGYLHLIAGKGSGWELFTWNDNARYDHFRWTKEDKARYSFLGYFFPNSGEYEEGKPYRVDESFPMLAARADVALAAGETRVLRLCLLYDDGKAINYFGTPRDAYWKKDGATAADIAADSVTRFDEYLTRARQFSRAAYADACRAGGEQYAQLTALAFRQAVNAHKLIADENGEAVFLSKECNSNGCIGTVDISYPSMPMFVLYNPELVLGMMRPILRYAASDAWPHPFSPHDVGVYPNAVGQVYSGTSPEGQMPVEECGNMLLMTAAATFATGDLAFFRRHYATLRQWCDYLLAHAQDPENQLCTDDFTGHLAHNANLAVKGICAIGAFGRLCGMDGRREEETQLLSRAREMAETWRTLARDEAGHYRLAYDLPGSWSLKYNLVWDQVFGLGLFDAEVYRTEAALYQRKLHRYGVPLDSRADFTKVDFLHWASMLGGDPAHFSRITARIWDMVNETPDRYAFNDWYMTSTARRCYFINRAVIGGLFLRQLEADGRLYRAWER